MSAQALADAVAAAAKGTGLAGPQPGDPAPEGTSKDEATGDETPATPEPTGGTDDVDLTDDDEDEDEESDIPASVFGVDLSALDAKTREEFIREFTETNKTLARVQRENADLRAGNPPAPAEEPDGVVDDTVTDLITDEELAVALGIDLENSAEPERDQREIALARGFLELKEVLDELRGTVVADRSGAAWDRKVSELVSEFGELPAGVDLRKTGLADPEAAYWAVVGPVRAQMSSELNKKLEAQRKAGKKAASTPRPKTSAPATDKLKSTDAKSAVRESLLRTIAKRGITLSDN